jgi:PAS domain S-box-containing protein
MVEEPGAETVSGAPDQLGEDFSAAQIISQLPNALIVRDRLGLVRSWNAAAEKLYGWKAAEALGQDADELLKSRPASLQDRLDHTSTPASGIVRMKANGDEVRVQAEFSREHAADGRLAYSIEVSREAALEVTPRSITEAESYQRLFDAMVATIEVDVAASFTDLIQASALANGSVRSYILARPELVQGMIGKCNILKLNDRFVEIFGYQSVGEISGLESIWPSASRDSFVDMLLALQAGAPHFSADVHLLAKSGATLSARVTCGPLPNAGIAKRVALGLLDVTEQTLENAALKRRLENHRALFQNMPIALCRVNSNALNDQRASIDAGGQNVEEFLTNNPSLISAVGEACFIEEANSQAARLLGAASADDLAGLPVGFAWRTRPESFAKILAAGILHSSCELETQLDTLDGRIVNVLFASAVLDDGGERRSMIGMIDIDDRLAAQEAFDNLQSEFAHESRISLLGELAASIAHEISQPLSAISTTGSTGLRWLGHDEPRVEKARDSLEKIVTYAQRASGIIERVRQMAAGRTPVMSTESFDQIIKSAIQLVEAQARTSRVAISFQATAVERFVRVDRTQIEQVIVNLIVNAIQAISGANPTTRRVEVRVRNEGERITCVVMDSGPGIEHDRIEEVFERFVSSKAEGTGLGLALCRSIINAHRGRITAHGHSPLGGALFEFELPAVPA